jgi:hypothetical protein
MRIVVEACAQGTMLPLCRYVCMDMQSVGSRLAQRIARLQRRLWFAQGWVIKPAAKSALA